MKEKGLRIFIFVLCMLLLCSSTVFATNEGSEVEVIDTIAGKIVQYVAWFAAAIALGVMIFIGIKYVMSGANEKADIKHMLPVFMVGLFIIILSATISSFFAEDVAGSEDYNEILDVGEKAGDYFGH